MSGKPNGKDPNPAPEPTEEERAQQEFAAGWDTANDELSLDTKPGKTESTDAPPEQKGDGAAASSGGAAPSAADGGKETPPAEGAEGTKPGAEAAGEGAAAPDGDGTPSAEGGGEETDPLDARFQAFEQKMLGALDERSAKNDRDLNGRLGGFLGRVKEMLDGAGANQQTRPGGGQTAETPPAESPALPESLKARIAKLKETDPETAEAIEVSFLAQAELAKGQGEKIAALEGRINQGEQRGQQQSEQATANARLDALMPGVPWREFVAVDDQNMLTHEGFAKFVSGQPWAAVNEFWSTDDPEVATKFIRSFLATQETGGKPAKDSSTSVEADAGGGQPGGTNGSTQAAPSADDAKRRLQAEAGTSVPGSKQSAPTESTEEANTFEAGWKQADAEDAAAKKAALQMRKDRAASQVGGMPGF